MQHTFVGLKEKIDVLANQCRKPCSVFTKGGRTLEGALTFPVCSCKCEPLSGYGKRSASETVAVIKKGN